ncbi:MAG TPA: nicotinamide riboside transporter PnuC [Paludibacteraceae bacterium]|nr:nicotinamide riboside transporter PnuC [Paludibacteraceae bacterium]HPT42713.1 nicotinamide riboside transporter PnuC [Paludibacteraceae bacterium]
MKIIELVAVVFGILSVWFASRESIRVFPTGIINVLLFIYIFFIARLYANAGINVLYLITNIYGWYNWSRKIDDKNVLEISRTTARQNTYIILFAAVFYISVLLLLRWYNKSDLTYVNSYVPWMDAMNSSLFLCATILMTKKKLENWIFWILGNVISIPITISQGLYMTSFQYLVFLFLAISGYVGWKKKLQSIKVSE